MKDCCFYTDKKLRICAWEKEIADFTGRDGEDIIGNKYFTVVPQILKDNKDALSHVVRTKKALRLKKYSFPCFFGTLIADISIKSVKSPDKKKELIQVTISPDGTCIASRKLLQSKRLIDIGKVASTLAHGVRNPLNAIKGAVVYLREKYTTEETLGEFTEIMEQEISRLEEFISKFLSSSVSETMDSETDINALLKKIEIFTALQIYTKNIHSYYEFGDIPSITINAFHLEHAILNVINNALEAMPNNGKLLIKSSTETRSRREFVVIAVSDTGAGISESMRKKLFPAGERKGRGFGLFITEEILNHYGGHIEIESKVNVGTTISLFLPVVQASEKSPS